MDLSSVTSSGVIGAVTALGVTAAATVGLCTGHLSSSDWLTVTGIVAGGSTLVGTAHVVGTQVNNAATTAAPTPVTPAAPVTGGTV